MTFSIQKQYKKAFFLFVVCLFMPCFAAAQSLSQIYEHTPSQAYEILDAANILAPQEEEELKKSLQNIEAQTSAQGAIITIQSTEEYPIAEIALTIHRQWGVGKSENNNGFVILIAPNEKRWFISTGDGLEGTIPDLRASHIGQTHFPQHFKQKNYAKGLQEGLKDIQSLIQNDPTTRSKYEQKEKPNAIEQYGAWLLFAFLLGLLKTNLFVLPGPKKQYFTRSVVSTLILATLLSNITIATIGFLFFAIYWPLELLSIFGGDALRDHKDFFDGFGDGGSGDGFGGFGGSGGSFGGGFGGGSSSGGGAGGSW